MIWVIFPNALFIVTVQPIREWLDTLFCGFASVFDRRVINSAPRSIQANGYSALCGFFFFFFFWVGKGGNASCTVTPKRRVWDSLCGFLIVRIKYDIVERSQSREVGVVMSEGGSKNGADLLGRVSSCRGLLFPTLKPRWGSVGVHLRLTMHVPACILENICLSSHPPFSTMLLGLPNLHVSPFAEPNLSELSVNMGHPARSGRDAAFTSRLKQFAINTACHIFVDVAMRFF